jgi:hypothetical protein
MLLHLKLHYHSAAYQLSINAHLTVSLTLQGVIVAMYAYRLV